MRYYTYPVGKPTSVIMELTPTEKYAPVGTQVMFTCMYHNDEKLDIVILENGIPIFRNTDIYWCCEGRAYKQWFVEVNQLPTFIQCMIRNNQSFVVGVLTARLYPGLKSFLTIALHLCSILPFYGAGMCVVRRHCCFVLFLSCPSRFRFHHQVVITGNTICTRTINNLIRLCSVSTNTSEYINNLNKF